MLSVVVSVVEGRSGREKAAKRRSRAPRRRPPIFHPRRSQSKTRVHYRPAKMHLYQSAFAKRIPRKRFYPLGAAPLSCLGRGIRALVCCGTAASCSREASMTSPKRLQPSARPSDVSRRSHERRPSSFEPSPSLWTANRWQSGQPNHLKYYWDCFAAFWMLLGHMRLSPNPNRPSAPRDLCAFTGLTEEQGSFESSVRLTRSEHRNPALCTVSSGLFTSLHRQLAWEIGSSERGEEIKVTRTSLGLLPLPPHHSE